MAHKLNMYGSRMPLPLYIPLRTSIDPRAAVIMSDALPTGFECGILGANVFPRASVVIIRAGPVSIAALLTARLYSPKQIFVVGRNEPRLTIAKKLGADATITSSAPDVLQQLLVLTNGEDFDSVIEAVGIPETFALSQDLVTVGGRIANAGVHGVKVDLHLEALWDRNINIYTSLVNGTTTPQLLDLVKSGLLDVSSLVTHSFPLSEATKAYDTFKAASTHNALKVVIDFTEMQGSTAKI